ncbi:hypothetical protein [Bradyrhizobium sp. SZCCHNR2032]|uniref:hypothetical protein n=1 Tax=Bradyrhizobium sp. SZCCHNR2032 TaxID=3057384 RepID=UPI002915E3C2|nr:hypothetical protein [Bradyrhizobium sp. SZCCHNR2032]
MPSKSEYLHYSAQREESPRARDISSSGMADASDEQLDRFFAKSEEPYLGNSFCSSGRADEFEDTFAELESDSPALITDAPPESPPSPAAPMPAATPAPDHDRLAKLIALLRNGRAASKAKAAEREKRNHERHLAAKEAHRREMARSRQQRHRANVRAAKNAAAEKAAGEILKELESITEAEPMPGRVSRHYHKRLVALQAATANPNGDKFLIRIRGREAELTEAWVVEQDARKKLGKTPSQAAVARLHLDKSMTKRRVQSLREIIATLEEPGRPWHTL